MKKIENTMVRNMKDLKEQSKIMENMSTNQQIKQSEQKPDPIQYTSKK
ncbi:hypothetical protein [Metabacillus litoralis]|nr:hypothetical protein [Metabacillus litoralis]